MDKREKDVLIVSIDEFSLRILKEKLFYATAKNVGLNVKYVAFYQKAPISSVTHYGIIKQVRKGGKNEVGVTYWLRNFPERNPPYNIIDFSKIEVLQKPIVKDSTRAVQGPIYSSFRRLMKAKVLSDISR